MKISRIMLIINQDPIKFHEQLKQGVALFQLKRLQMEVQYRAITDDKSKNDIRYTALIIGREYTISNIISGEFKNY